MPLRERAIIIGGLFMLLILVLVIVLDILPEESGKSFAIKDVERERRQGKGTPWPTSIPSPTEIPLPTQTLYQDLGIDDPIRVPFIRDESVYLYDNGNELLLASPEGLLLSPSPADDRSYRYENETEKECDTYQDPKISYDGRFIGYIHDHGEETGLCGCENHTLVLYDINTSQTVQTPYDHVYRWQWNADNTIQIYDMNHSIVYNPNFGQEVSRIDLQEKEDWPFEGPYVSSTGMEVRQSEGNWVLFDQQQSIEKILFQDTEPGEAYEFHGWSPDGTYAIFESTESGWFSVNTKASGFEVTQIEISQSAAGGLPSVGLRWYFNQAFVPYCSWSYAYPDGREPRSVIRSEGQSRNTFDMSFFVRPVEAGGGCNNEDGIVATSPGGQYAFVAFYRDHGVLNHFELHEKNGTKQEVTLSFDESVLEREQFQWLNDDYLIISSRDKNAILLFDRKSNRVIPLIDNARAPGYTVTACGG